MSYLCLNCYEVYDETIQNVAPIQYGIREYRMCPKNNCNGEIIEVDEMLVPIIIELNKKGYSTEYCCSAHTYDDENCVNTYIMFSKGYKPETVPKGFTLETPNYNNNICLRKFYVKIKDKLKLHKQIMQTMIDLSNWVKKLPNCNKI